MNTIPPEHTEQVESEVQSYQPDVGWHWHDAALIVFERQDRGRSEYAVGAVDLYANALTGDLGGSYLELGAFSSLDRAADQYSRLQTAIDDQMLLPFQLADYFDRRLQDKAHKSEWRTAGPDEYAAYEAIRSLDMPDSVISAEYSPFEGTFADGNTRLLEPVDPAVNYSFDVIEPDPYTLELRANKWWIGEDGALRHNGLTVNSYSLESFEFERESEREIAAMDREDLEQTHQQEGLEASMRKAEAIAVTSGELDPNREGGRLFYEGPSDRFMTLREAELAGREHAEVAVERDEWQELLDRAENDQPEPERHYWQLHHRSVETPDGEPLGTALVMIEFPQLPPDFGAYLEEHGMDDSIYPTQARTLEVGHFANEAASKKFEDEFRSYLVPGILDGPELAPEVARLEGLPGMWEPLGSRDIVAFMSGTHADIRKEAEWHLHDTHVEHDIREPRETFDFDLL
jgi:hypothetical protein